MEPSRLLPDDPALPGLAALRTRGLRQTLPELDLEPGPVDLRLFGYSRGLRATVEARTAHGRLAIKCYAKDPGSEARLYRALALAGFNAQRSRVRAPSLLAWRPDLRLLAIAWLEGPSASE